MTNDFTAVQWSPQQSSALQKAKDWMQAWALDSHSAHTRQIFKLFGFAGSGKTTLSREMALMAREIIGGPVYYAAFTGKAALVMQRKGCTGAQTIHSLIYSPVEMEDPDTGETIVEFDINPDSPLKDAGLLIVDECSMVGKEQGEDLLSFGIPILVLGDPGQLPPIVGTGFFTTGTPDVMLTEIHRQAADNPIIRMSMDIRTGKGLRKGSYGDSRVIAKDKLTHQDLLDADQVIVGLNRTRRLYNLRIRALRGFGTPNLPMQGEKLICLRNNRRKALLNGGMWEVDKPPKLKGDCIEMDLSSLDIVGRRSIVEVPLEFFVGEEDKIPHAKRRRLDEFDFGHCITGHKSQGSQWSNVLVYNENYCFREDAVKWLYTVVTRAADKLTLAL